MLAEAARALVLAAAELVGELAAAELVGAPEAEAPAPRLIV